MRMNGAGLWLLGLLILCWPTDPRLDDDDAEGRAVSWTVDDRGAACERAAEACGRSVGTQRDPPEPGEDRVRR